MPTRKKRGGGASQYSVQFAGVEAKGNLRKRVNTISAPNISFFAEPPDELYTVVLWDPDSPNPSYLHWLVINIPGEKVDAGQVLVPYKPPTPPSGVHTYHVGLFVQKERLDFFAPGREDFDIDDFVAQYNLTRAGEKTIQVAHE